MVTRTKGRSCTGKAQYTRKEAARVARRRLGRYSSYRCKFCGAWHVGHSGAKKRKRW